MVGDRADEPVLAPGQQRQLDRIGALAGLHRLRALQRDRLAVGPLGDLDGEVVGEPAAVAHVELHPARLDDDVLRDDAVLVERQPQDRAVGAKEVVVAAAAQPEGDGGEDGCQEDGARHRRTHCSV